MDKNKLKVLQEIGYEIRETCSICSFADIAYTDDFGVCIAQTYEHEKHTGEPRQLSIHASGWCRKFEKSHQSFDLLHSYQQFIKKPEESK